MDAYQLRAACVGAGIASFALGSTRRFDLALRPLGAVLIGMGLALAATPALADQYKQAADSVGIDCTLSRHELTRIALIGDSFASVSKISSGTPYNDFAVTHEPVRGDIYLSVPDAYGPSRVSFFATSKHGYVYKFGCALADLPAEQVFITNPALAKSDAADWESETPIDASAVRLIQAMANQATLPGYEIRQSASVPVRAGDLEIQLIAEYRGSALSGKTIRLVNRTAKPLALKASDIAPKAALAVSLGADTLAPHATTTALIAIANAEQGQ